MPNRGTNVLRDLLPLNLQHGELESVLFISRLQFSWRKNGADDASHNEAKQSEEGSCYRRS